MPRNRLTLCGNPTAMVTKMTGVAMMPTMLENSCVTPTLGRVGSMRAIRLGFCAMRASDILLNPPA